MEAYVLFPRGKERREVRCEEEEEDIGCPSESELSMSSSWEELADDASSPWSTDHFEMSSLVTQLPLKRGLSTFFHGRSQSFASLAAVGSLEDLAKPLRKRLKTSRGCGVGLQDAHRGHFSGPLCHNPAAAAACKKASPGEGCPCSAKQADAPASDGELGEAGGGDWASFAICLGDLPSN